MHKYRYRYQKEYIKLNPFRRYKVKSRFRRFGLKSLGTIIFSDLLDFINAAALQNKNMQTFGLELSNAYLLWIML